MANSNFKASSSLFSVNLDLHPDSTEDFSMDAAVEIIRDYLAKKYSLTAQPAIKLADGQLLVLTANEDSPNSSLVCVVRSYSGKTRLITINLEGAGPLNTGSLDHESGDFISRKETFGINNSSMDLIKNDLNGLFETDVERIPVLKRGTRVPVYFPSSDERVLEYDFNKTVVNENSKYQNIKILSSPSLGNCLLLDNLQNLAEADLNYTQGLMDYGKVDYRDKEILILGGGDGGLLHELLKEKPKFVTMIDIDGLVIEKCRQHLKGACGDTLETLEGENYKVIVDDCLKWLDRYAGESRKFDFVFNDLTDIPLSSEKTEVGRDLWNFVKTILNKSFKCLKPDGLYMNHAVGKGCVAALTAYEKVLNDLPFKVKFTQSSRWVPSFCEEWIFYQVALCNEEEAKADAKEGLVETAAENTVEKTVEMTVEKTTE